MNAVSSDKDPVVCRLMDFKREEYRKLKQQRASAKRVQKKKEVRLRVRWNGVVVPAAFSLIWIGFSFVFSCFQGKG